MFDADHLGILWPPISIIRRGIRKDTARDFGAVKARSLANRTWGDNHL